MCIVQREETLDLIANRYNVQPRELQLFNRMHEPYLSEGQVLYIP
nr:LysM peptidoglycan-binding domain-containing protein [Cohnella sp. WQ 127256]